MTFPTEKRKQGKVFVNYLNSVLSPREKLLFMAKTDPF